MYVLVIRNLHWVGLYQHFDVTVLSISGRTMKIVRLSPRVYVLHTMVVFILLCVESCEMNLNIEWQFHSSVSESSCHQCTEGCGGKC